MRNPSRLTLALAVASALLIVGGCEVRQTQQARAPKVEVTDPGQPPKYDVRGPDVAVTTQKREITVPNVTVQQEKREIEVPHVTVTPPSDTDKKKADTK